MGATHTNIECVYMYINASACLCVCFLGMFLYVSWAVTCACKKDDAMGATYTNIEYVYMYIYKRICMFVCMFLGQLLVRVRRMIPWAPRA
jgi:hypothetical protein